MRSCTTRRALVLQESCIRRRSTTNLRGCSAQGLLFHYTGTPNKLTSRRDVPREITKRLEKAGFTVKREGDGLLARRGR